MDKRLILLTMFTLSVLIILNGCKNLEKTVQNTDSNTGPLLGENSQLSELQEVACVSADDAGTCSTKLESVGIVSKEDCCKYLGRCC